jgi:transketolase
MMNETMHIRGDWESGTEKAATRDGFGTGVLEAGRADERIVVLSADLTESTRAEWFQKEFPHRFIEIGVAEQNLATVSAGMANYGKIPFFTSYAAFSPGRNWEQIRTTIALNNVHAVVCGMHAGISVGPDGATHQMLEDMAIMRAMPHMIVISPCDAEEARKATIAAAKIGRPVYMRFGREKTPLITTPETPFSIGEALVLYQPESPRVALFATGPLVHAALLSARALEREGIAASVTNVHTISPLDETTIERMASQARAVVTIEEHQITGGLGGAVAECLARRLPCPIEFIGVQNQFGQSGTPDELYAHYGMDVPHILEAAKKVIARV